MCKLCKGKGTYRGITGRDIYCGCLSGTKAEIDALEASIQSSAEFQSLSRPEQIAQLLRINTERWAIQRGYKRSLQHLCGLCSAALAQALRREGFRPTVVEGEVGSWRHAWVTLRGKIIDVTFTQFDGSAPRVLISAKTDKRFRPVHTFNGKRLDRWLINPKLVICEMDIETLITFQSASTLSGDPIATESDNVSQ
jgi:hypothetical protein